MGFRDMPIDPARLVEAVAALAGPASILGSRAITTPRDERRRRRAEWEKLCLSARLSSGNG